MLRVITGQNAGKLERLAGHFVFGTKSLIGQEYKRSISFLASEAEVIGGKGVDPMVLLKVLQSIVAQTEREAVEAGAKKVVLTGEQIVKPELQQLVTKGAFAGWFRRRGWDFASDSLHPNVTGGGPISFSATKTLP
jgi:hypothetical protein